MLLVARHVRSLVRGSAPPTSTPPLDDRVRELVVASFERSTTLVPRVNLLVPTVAGRRTFGGVRTAIELFEAVAEHAPRRRIVSVAPLLEGAVGSTLSSYRWTDPAADDDAGRTLTSLGGASAASRLSIGPADAFMATFWTTAELGLRIQRWQAAAFGLRDRPMLYLIQDFEPAFYPWSAQWLLARATYEPGPPIVAVFNTSLLKAYFDRQGIHFAHEFAFEPRLAPELIDAAKRRGERARRIVVYGRPGTPRNAFPLVVDGLRRWVATDNAATDWTVVSAGEPHPPVDIGRGLRLESVGKLDLEAYGDLLRSSAIGLSLMVSPHPSYPPLEMAHLGMLVLTNRFEVKDLATWHSNVRSLTDVSAAGVAEGLSELCRSFETDPRVGEHGRAIRTDLLEGSPQFPFALDVARLLGVATIEGHGPS